MAKNVKQFQRFQGIADFDKESVIPDQFAWGRSVDYRTNPRQLTLLPKTTKESGNVVIDLQKWATSPPSSLIVYTYGDAGNFYSRSTAGSWSLLNTAPNSHGNGLAYYQEDDYVYYTSDKVIGRYGKLSSNPQFTNDFLGAQGGVPTNTNSVTFVAASSQYADRADTASLSITGDLTLEAYFKLTTLPAVGSSMTLVSKWDQSGATRSYIMDILGISGYFGDGSSGSLTISADTTDTPIDSACTGTINTNTLSATNASFVANQIIFIHQTQGTGAGTWQRNQIQSYTAGTITTTTPLNATYTVGAQVMVMKQYTTVTINAGKTYLAKTWNGITGGILAFLANSTFTYAGTVSALGRGFRGAGDGISVVPHNAAQGEGVLGFGTDGNNANGNGGGGGAGAGNSSPGSGGGGGSNATTGAGGGTRPDLAAGDGATLITGSSDLTTMTFGGGAGSGGATSSEGSDVSGNGGGIVFISAASIAQSGSGSITANGADGLPQTSAGAVGGGAGGDILLKAQTATLGTGAVEATGGAGGISTLGGNGGGGGGGRIHLDYLTSFTGTTDPTLNATQDNTLVTTASYQARLGISANGTAFEYLTKLIAITTDMWYRLSISWLSASSLATFYLNAVSVGSTTGLLTAINNNASRFGIAMNRNGAGSPANFLDGKLDDVRVWNTTRSASDIFNNTDSTLTGAEAGLAAYYQLNNNYDDTTANANIMTATNSPVFTTDVPFVGATTRLDIDQAPSPEPTGSTYDVPTAINEDAADRLTFTPDKDPQASLDVDITTAGTGDLTITVHDQQNRVLATKTIVAANVSLGYLEFIFATPWRPVLGNTYHFHITSTQSDTEILAGTIDEMETIAYHTYFGFLVNDPDFHPIAPMLNFLAIGNERYIATWNGVSYEPNLITLPAGWRIRCFGYWTEYLAIGVWKGSNIYDYDEGRVYFWDGISVTFNFYIDLPGGVNAIKGTKGELHMFVGYQGEHLMYSGGTMSTLAYRGGTSAVKLKKLPKVTREVYVEMFPGALTMWKGLIHYGVAGNSDSTEIERGVYSWGSINTQYPDSLSYDYPISTGNRTAVNIKVGMIFPAGRKLLIGWQDNVSYGVDVVDVTGDPFASGTVEFLIQDDDFIWRDQKAFTLRGDFFPLVTGESVDIKYKLDRQASWIGLTDLATATNTTDEPGVVRLPIENGQNREYQLAIDLFSTGSTSPTILGESLYEDQLEEENAF